FDLTLTELEENELSPLLRTFLTGLADNAAQAASQAPPEIALRYQNILCQMNVARALLENRGPAKAYYFSDPSEEEKFLADDQKADTFDNAKAIFTKYSSGLPLELVNKGVEELRLIYSANSGVPSPLWGQYGNNNWADYTQYVPRSHYNKNSG